VGKVSKAKKKKPGGGWGENKVPNKKKQRSGEKKTGKGAGRK
jgi:hypothetical protein